MEKPSEEQAAAEPMDSAGEDGPSVAGAQEAPPEDHISLLLRLFPLASSAGTKWRDVAKSSALRCVWLERLGRRRSH